MATRARKSRTTGKRAPQPGKQDAQQAQRAQWPQIIGEAFIIGLILSVPLVINTRSRNICDIKDVVTGLGVAAGLALWLIAALSRGRVSWLRSKVNLAVFAFVAWAGISIIYARYRYVTVSEFARLASHLGLFWLAILSLRSFRQVRRIVAAGAVVAIPMCIYAFCQAAGVDFVNWSAPVERAFSFMGNPTYLGGFLMLLIPPVIAVGITYLPSRGSDGAAPRRWTGYALAGFFFVAAAAMLVCMYYSVTLSGMIGLGLAAVVALLLVLIRGGARAARAALPIAGIALVVFLPIAYLGYTRLPPIQQARIQQVLHFQDPYSQERRLHWKTALDIFRERPAIGEGFGAFRVYSLEKMAPEWYAQSSARSEKMLVPGYAHNEYLQILSDLGIVGGVLFYALLLGGYGLAIWTALRHPDLRWATVSLGITAALTAFLFQNIFGITFRQAGAVTFFWLWLAVIILAAAVRPREGLETTAPRLREFRFRPVRLVGLIPITVAFAVVWALLYPAAVNPMLASMELRQAQGLAGLGRYKEAAQHADRALALCRYSPMGYYVAAYAWGQSGDLDKALAANKKALSMMPGNASIWYNLGVSYKSKGQFKEAEESFKRAIEYMPTNFRHHAAMAETLVTENRPKEAEPYARDAIRLAPGDPGPRLLLADILGRQGKLKEMIEEMRQAAAISPTDTRLKQQITSFYFKTGDFERGAAAARDWMQVDPTSAVPHNAVGTYYFNKRQYAAAKQEFERAVQLDPSYVLARYNLALSLGHLNDYNGAAGQLREVVARAPDTAEGRKAQALLNDLARQPSARPRR